MMIICKQREFHFFSYLDSFYLFSSLIVMAKTSKTMLNSSGESSADFKDGTIQGKNGQYV